MGVLETHFWLPAWGSLSSRTVVPISSLAQVEGAGAGSGHLRLLEKGRAFPTLHPVLLLGPKQMLLQV